MQEEKVVIYTDGACSGNPGIGGWGVVMFYKGHFKELFDGEEDTTNNKMELTAVIQALSSLKRECSVELYTDSTYVKDGMTKWIFAWKKNGWKTKNKKEVKNQELWQKLDELNQKHKIEWNWIKGHDDNEYNEKADSLARQGIKKIKTANKLKNI